MNFKAICTQLGMALFGLTAMYCALSNDPVLRFWAPIVGLAGQPFWAAFAWKTRAWGMGVIVVAYSAVYVRGIWVQWGGA